MKTRTLKKMMLRILLEAQAVSDLARPQAQRDSLSISVTGVDCSVRLSFL